MSCGTSLDKNQLLSPHPPNDRIKVFLLSWRIKPFLLQWKPACFWPKGFSAQSISWLPSVHQRHFAPTPPIPATTSNHISADLWSVTCVGIRCRACLSITQILTDKIPWPYIACPFKGYCQQMLRINTDLPCHWPGGGMANEAPRNQAGKNSAQLAALVPSFAMKPVVLQISIFYSTFLTKSCDKSNL